MPHLEMKLRTRWFQVEPDGSECFNCGDKCLLDMYELMVSIDGKPFERLDNSVAKVCQSCIGVISD